jgi:hypothetical protein
MATPRTGRPRGRPPGSRNRRTLQAEAAAQATAAAIAAALPAAFEGDAHALLMALYKNPSVDLHVRLDAAKVAIRFEKPLPAPLTAEQSPVRSPAEEARRVELLARFQEMVDNLREREAAVRRRGTELLAIEGTREAVARTWSGH